ncbi:gliding motility protein GldG [alpha proteobacterium U9-1i]|nr:gliding motility protein GldG [alpha proteobacterium U9-1i]
MSGRRFALFAAAAFLVMFVATNLIANTWFRTWRLDLTQNQLYSLSEGTERTLDGLHEPVELRFYFSRDAASTFPAVQTYGARVREMLQTFQARSNGRVRFVEVNVEPFSEEEDAAVEAGIEARQVIEGADPIYMGLAGANAIDDQVAISFLDPSREPFLEYEITRLIYELENPDLARVALITSLPLDPALSGGGAFGAQPSMFETELGRLMNVEKLPPTFTSIPDGVDVLAIIHPGPLSPTQLYAIDQFIMHHGRAFIALDPASMVAQRSAGGMDPFSAMMGGAPTSSNLEPLLERWGLAMTREVVLDLDGALPVQAQDPQTGQPMNAPQPLFFRVPPAQRDSEDMLTAWLPRDMNFGLAGALTWSEREGVTVTPLASTSGRTRRIAAERALMQPSPFELLQDWPAGGRIETVALRLSGTLETAYPDGAPAIEPVAPAEGDAPTPAAAPQGETLARSATPAELVIVADADFLDDAFYVASNGAPAADNGAFALNAIDILSGSDALVSLRSRAPSERRMELVDAMERDAQRRIESRQQELEAELAETEQRLADLQTRGRGSGFFSGDLGAELTAEERVEIERFREQVVNVRGELRSVSRELRGDIDQLETLIVFINVWLAPILVAGAGLYLFWRRQRRTRRARR